MTYLSAPSIKFGDATIDRVMFDFGRGEDAPIRLTWSSGPGVQGRNEVKFSLRVSDDGEVKIDPYVEPERDGEPAKAWN